MTRTAIIYSPKYLLHKTGPRHPESPSRLRVILRELNSSGVLENENCNLVEPEMATVKDLKLVHDQSYVQQIKNFCDCGGGLLDVRDTVVSSNSYNVALLAAGGAIKGVDLVMNNTYQNAFAFVRPPGHHAGPCYPMGFCIFNNVAVAASYLLKKFNLEQDDLKLGDAVLTVTTNDNKAISRVIDINKFNNQLCYTGFIKGCGEIN